MRVGARVVADTIQRVMFAFTAGKTTQYQMRRKNGQTDELEGGGKGSPLYASYSEESYQEWQAARRKGRLGLAGKRIRPAGVYQYQNSKVKRRKQEMKRYYSTLREARKGLVEYQKTEPYTDFKIFLAYKIWPNRKKRRYFVGTRTDWNFEKYS